MLTVAAGLIVEGDRILLGQRSPFGSHPFKWEFPGGKVEAGETIEEALRRELREELEITAHHIEEVHRYEFAYPGKKPIEFSEIDFAGALTVADPEKLRAALFTGIGRARAYGCGLMLVQRLV